MHAESPKVSWRTAVPSLRITYRLREPSRSLSNTMAAPSGLNAERPSAAGCAVRRMAEPPEPATFHRSPRQLKTRTLPSGLAAGERGRSTVPASAAGAHAATASAPMSVARAANGA